MICVTPLQWPATLDQRLPEHQKYGRFKANGRDITTAEAVARLAEELGRLKANNAELSANFIQGRSRVSLQVPRGDDQGVCLRFDLDGTAYVLPCDTYTFAGDNIAALAAHIDATRAITRHGVASTAQALEAFAALPPRGGIVTAAEQIKPKRPWFEVLGIFPSASIELIEAAYKVLVKNNHPDVGGDTEAFQEIQTAIEEARSERA
jgi:DnaJ-domain-containing protein 1